MKEWSFDVKTEITVKCIPDYLMAGLKKLQGHEEKDDDGTYFEYSESIDDDTEIRVYLEGDSVEKMYIRCTYGDEYLFEELVPYKNVVEKLKFCEMLINKRMDKDAEAGLKALFG